jgi:lysophospholipase L1-like esterase
VRFIGRVQRDGDFAKFAWSGTGIVAAFEGTAVSLQLEDGGSNQFSVLIDGNLKPTFKPDSGSHVYELATGLAAGRHEIEIYRRTEASFGPSIFQGFAFTGGGELLAPRAVNPRQIEFIGDSITCGYGDEGTVPTCGFSADTENHYLTYAALTARALDAEASTVAWSGKGIIYNYDADVANPMPSLYGRVLPDDANSAWDFSVAYDAVVINLGTNDFSTDNDPTPELFRDSYVALLERIREEHPAAAILCTVGPMLSGADLEAARAGIAAAVAVRAAAGDRDVEVWEMNIANDAPGCDYHPSLATHQKMADALVAELKQRLGW